MSNKIRELLTVLLSFKKLLPVGEASRKRGKVTCLQMHVLGFIEKNPKIGMNDIAKFLSITPPSATSLVNQLVRTQMLTRVPDTTDRRKVLLLLTPKGKKTFSLAKEHFLEKMAQVFDALSEKEIDTLIHLMEKVISAKSK